MSGAGLSSTTITPRAFSLATTRDPTVPVAPMTATVVVASSSDW